ncbi:hypothetical protein [Paenisporosarcina sp. OV554]|uniref:hypothetical protein n=1 Tax=Paenisporosarcina sp. OV554 TaxID=2135694 RepID=UPI000D4EAD59|nr:hypothetical protein [Paenisporosarcina sp. OV554]PUB12205.1 hypothetical protein C8K15_11010 [Paenisporosarcina sp. OV554]
MKKILTVLFTIMVLTACSETINNDYKFVGESEHWEAEYSYKGTEIWGEDDGKRTYSNEDSYEFVLKYKGSLEELSYIKKLEYSYKVNSLGESGTQEYTEPPRVVIISSKGSSKGGAKVGEDEVIKVNVKWDDFAESFELHNKSK